MGFRDLLKMKTDHIPAKLGFYLVDKLDTLKKELQLAQGTIKLSTQMVHDMLGTPIGGTNLTSIDAVPRAKSVRVSWRRQFPGNRIRISDVMKKVKSSEIADFQFKINFLMLFLSTMAECNSCGYCNSGVIDYITEDTDISKIDWSKYVLSCLMRSKDQWKRENNSQTFYSGPITFLTLLYADITECIKFDVERTRPAICVWNMELLRRRENLELTDGGFGTWPLIVHGEIQKDRPFAERSGCSKVSSKPTLKDYIDNIKSKMKSILSHKQSAELTIEKAISDFPTESALRLLDVELRRLFNQHDGDTGGYVHDQNKEHVFETPKRKQGSNQDESKNVSDKDPIPTGSIGLELVAGIPLEDDEYWNNLTTHMEIDNSYVEYCKRKKFNMDDAPKFDLGTSPESKSESPQPISYIHPIKKGMFSLNSRLKSICDAPRPIPGKREAKLGDVLRSPYVKRTVVIDVLETSSEKKVCAWINAAVEPVCEPVFETTTGAVALRGTIESLCARTHIYSNVIDSWAALLNHEERFRNKVSPRRLFFHSAILTDTMLNLDTKPDVKIQLFVENILAAVGGDGQMITFKTLDLVFFPIVRDMHFFVVVFNFKRPSVLIIDNIQQALDSPPKFEEIPDLLHTLMIQHLHIVRHPLYDQMAVLEPIRIAVRWGTKENSHDCGVFLMRHMECYMGQLPYKWKCGLDEEGPNQARQLQVLRNKYTAKLLLSDVNLRRSFVISDCEKFCFGREREITTTASCRDQQGSTTCKHLGPNIVGD